MSVRNLKESHAQFLKIDLVLCHREREGDVQKRPVILTGRHSEAASAKSPALVSLSDKPS